MGRLVYSTNKNIVIEDEEEQEAETLAPAEQKLYVSLDKKQRGGKKVTLIDGFIGTQVDLESLGKQLKNHCGVGGSAKDAEILIQGDHREKVKVWLEKNGYKVKSKG